MDDSKSHEEESESGAVDLEAEKTDKPDLEDKTSDRRLINLAALSALRQPSMYRRKRGYGGYGCLVNCCFLGGVFLIVMLLLCPVLILFSRMF